MARMFSLACNVPELGERRLSGGATIGRHPGNDIAIDDDLASRFHASIETDTRGRLIIKDLGSRNGTRVNEQVVTEVELNDGDVIRIGKHVFRVRSGGAEGGAEDRGAAAAAAQRVPAAPGDGGDGDDDGAHPDDIPLAGKGGRARPVRRKGPELGSSGRGSDWQDQLEKQVAAVASGGERVDMFVLIDTDGRPSGALEATSDGPRALLMLLRLAGLTRSTDIHIEPRQTHATVRMRIDGSMVQIVELPQEVAQLATRVVKTACQMKEGGRDAMADGHFSLMVGDVRIDYRASLTPTVHGQKLVLRVLDPRGVPRSLEALQFPTHVFERVRKVCEQDTGLMLVCGPTGSGKTTTLYNAMRSIDRDRRNVVTIEDPVEYSLDGVSQIPVTEKSDFNSVLRSVLRQDPDVILVGEIRDLETARTAMQAAMTGHVVFTTVHARDTIGSIFRLIDLGVETYLVANALDLVIAQRLVRVLCEHCKRAAPVTPGQATRIGKFLEGQTKTYIATGCAKCLRTGYHGRRAIFEMLDFANNDALRDLVLANPSIQKIRKTIEQGVFATLQQSGWRLAARGITSLDEIEHVTGNG